MVAVPLHDPSRRDFASDNYAGVHPEVLAALAAADGGHVRPYGADPYSEALTARLSAELGREVEVFPVLSGTGANVVALSSMLPPWGAAVCAATAHVHTDEGGAPEKVAGVKLLPVHTPDARLTPELIATEAWGWGSEHRAQPLVVTITQSTELGTTYTPEQIAAVTEVAHAAGMRVHLDGARIANAAAFLDVPLRALTTDVGVDVLSFGGTKNGAMAAEAVVVLDPEAAHGLRYLRKTYLQLASKTRFVSAQLLALLTDELWLRSARHANAMAQRLADGVRDLPGVTVLHPVEANAVFARLPAGVADQVRERFAFYDWDATGGEVRWMCAFDTTPEDVDAFVAAVADAVR
ncbi:beta-eliminating lyase-related protein [Actinotalea sp. M2MS4P-6]|uniref:threonine aldolase family protein n=1 Tax=Actinotalea sp. M2MS4P-6 TaxID=2983762 RepID=UPI0021E362B0|nr:beta-eliminating lyase-related protein [Actinotalea sp. M2MS4P-6]MCV2394636.1 beta-eliminating lyase-related protein [Actinotalea sp. M2MS4P-6]